jgi:hypothetical protein
MMDSLEVESLVEDLCDLPSGSGSIGAEVSTASAFLQLPPCSTLIVLVITPASTYCSLVTLAILKHLYMNMTSKRLPSPPSPSTSSFTSPHFSGQALFTTSSQALFRFSYL